MALQAIVFKLARLSVGNSMQRMQITCKANIFILVCNCINALLPLVWSPIFSSVWIENATFALSAIATAI
jgi:hypothetical protein